MRGKYWVRLNRDEASFIQEVQRRIGASSFGEALRFIIQYHKWMTEGEMALVPKEVLEIIRTRGGNAKEEG